MEFKNYGQADTNDGLIPHQDLLGLHEFTDNAGAGPIEPFEDFRGRGQKRRVAKKANRQNSKLQRINARKQGGGLIKNAQQNAAQRLAIKKDQAKANIIASKSLGKTDPSVDALLNNTNVETPKEKSNTGLYVGIGVGVVVLAIGAYLMIKKPWKKK